MRRRWKTAAGGEVRLGATASNWAHVKAGKMGYNQLAMILTPRRSFCGGLRRQKSGGAVRATVTEARKQQRRRKLVRVRLSAREGGRGEEAGRAGGLGRGKEAGPCAIEEEKRNKPAGLGRAGREGGRE
jgi:hypothetical protein